MNWLRSALILAFFLPIRTLAQSPADFTGTWQRDEARSESLGFGLRGPVTMVIAQNDGQLTITSRSPEQNLVLTFNLDGSKNQDPYGRNSVLRLEQHKLVSETSRFVETPMGRWWISTTQSYRLSKDRREITVETDMQLHHGYEGAGSPPTGRALDVFVRQAD